MKKVILLSCLLLLISGIGLAQTEKPFYGDIQHFKKIDSITPPIKNAILFIGSSSFTMWRDVQDYFPNHAIINRGFGGSSLNHLATYFNDLVPPYQPKQIVIYCGENDLANDKTPADTAVQRFKVLYKLIRKYNKKVPIAYISIKPSPSRAIYMQKFKEANGKIKQFLANKKNAVFINVFDSMLDNQEQPKDIFLSDNLHMRPEGYRIWQKIIEPYLKK